MSRFPQQAVSGLLSKFAADYWEYPINLCEQPLINAVGLALLGRPVFTLELSDEDCRELGSLLFGCKDISAELNRGIAFAVAELHAPKEAESYMRTVLCDTLPRLQAARQSGNVRGIFIVK